MRRAFILAMPVVLGCAPAPRVHTSGSVAERPKREGALLVAHAGTGLPFAITGAGSTWGGDVVRGRVRWNVALDGTATRAREVTLDPILAAVALPPWLGGGAALVAEDALALSPPNGPLRAIAKGTFATPSVSAHELWTRFRGGGDWVRISLGAGAKENVTREPPPIAAPIFSPWTSGAATGWDRQITAGPEFVSPTTAVALVDLLGPIVTTNGGETWSPLETTAMRSVFGASAPSRIVRVGGEVYFASHDTAAAVSAAGSLGVARGIPRAGGNVPEAVAIRFEAVAPHGVPLADDRILVSDGSRLAIAELDPIRVVRVTRATDLTRCELAKTESSVVAACVRTDDSALSSGGQVVIGTVDETPRVAVEKVFAFGAARQFSSTGALVVAAKCSGTSEGGVDLSSARQLCVRDAKGVYGDVELPATARRRVAPRSDGGIVVLREDEKGRALYGYPPGATTKTTPRRLDLAADGDVIALDEARPGAIVVWRRTKGELRMTTIDAATLRVTSESPATAIDSEARVGVFGARALVARSVSDGTTPEARGRISAGLTLDGGKTWARDAWPSDTVVLDRSATNVDCGPMGCRVFGWSRIGWEARVGTRDLLVDLSSAKPVPPPAAPPVHATTLVAKCKRTSPPQGVPLASVPLASYLTSLTFPSETLLGLPPPKAPIGHTLIFAPFARGAGVVRGGQVRGGVITSGPLTGVFGDTARSTVRFATDLDPLGVVHESLPFASPFPDRYSAKTSPTGIALAPGRALVSWCAAGRCELFRVASGATPERIVLPNVGIERVHGARELGSVVVIVGVGLPRDNAKGAWDPLPFVALVSGTQTTVSFLARAGWASDTVVDASVDANRGTFGLFTWNPLPTWTAGTGFVLPLGADARSAGGFEMLRHPSIALARPTIGCGGASVGWDRVERVDHHTLAISIDGADVTLHDAQAGTMRARIAETSSCLERVTVLSDTMSFQLDGPTKQAVHFAVDATTKQARRSELSCALAWD